MLTAKGACPVAPLWAVAVTAVLPAFAPVAVSFAVMLPPKVAIPTGLALQATGRGTGLASEQTAVKLDEPPTLIELGVAVTDKEEQLVGGGAQFASMLQDL